MSVINKMLRDLDQRQAAQAPTPGSTDAGWQRLPLRGTTSLPQATLPGAAGGIRRNRAIALAVLLLVGASGFGWWQSGHVSQAVPAQPVPVAVTVGAPVVAAQPAAAPRPVAPAVALAKQQRPRLAAAALQAPAAAPAAQPLASVLRTPTNAVPVTPSAAANISNPESQIARQLQAGRDALAQAQAQWSGGAHDAATELLQAAVGAAERSAASAPSAAQTQLLAALVRELGRMQLADGRAAAALQTLAHLEPQLGREADIWAMRGNAAQRLGKHQDSVQAYTTALQLRPNEPRWMLGSAVSLAALGQTAQAAELADKARALGPISKEVLAYLRQAGVRLTEP